MNIVKVLEKLGIDDINLLGINKLGLRYASPGNNPFNFGLKAWCFKHGVHVHSDEVEDLYARYPVLDNEDYRAEQEGIRKRYKTITGTNITTGEDAQRKKLRKSANNKKPPVSGHALKKNREL